MPSAGFNYSAHQYEVNRASGRSRQEVLKRLSLMGYDAFKFLLDFVRAMAAMVMGK